MRRLCASLGVKWGRKFVQIGICRSAALRQFLRRSLVVRAPLAGTSEGAGVEKRGICNAMLRTRHKSSAIQSRKRFQGGESNIKASQIFTPGAGESQAKFPRAFSADQFRINISEVS